MSVHIHDVLNYLDKCRAGQKAESMDSLLKTVYTAYEECNCFETDETKQRLHRIQDMLDILPQRLHDDTLYLIFDLCRSQEILAFSQGVLAGMLLMTEVNYLP